MKPVRLKLRPTEAEIDATLASVAPKYDGSEGCRHADAADGGIAAKIFAARLLVDRLLGQVARWRASAQDPGDCANSIAGTRSRLRAPELIAASHIVKHAKEEEDDGETQLAEVRASIFAGEDFAAAAKRFSDCPENSGDLGYFPRGVMVDEFDAVAFAAPVGQVTAPFRTQFGWHIVLVRDRRPEGVRAFDEVSEQIKARLLNEKQEREVGEKLNALREKAHYVELGRL